MESITWARSTNQMAKQKVTTKTTKKWRFSSFKARIDELKIEPARNLEKRTHDYVTTSHLLASYEHWKDTNLSAGFTNFTFEVENLIQTLPQILHHEKEIFNYLNEAIKRHDDKSLQPLLDLLAQFCHDLGPDFLKFYEDTIKTLVALLDEAIKFESTNVFEWGFNCLAYIFKYLSKILTENLSQTFDLLFPLLSHPKDYLSRFSAEALSFLIRKTKVSKLSIFINHALINLKSDDSSNLYEGLLTLFTETLTLTSGALHSKSSIILASLIKQCFELPNSEITIPLFCDILMQITRYADAENLMGPINTVLGVFKDSFDDLDINSLTRVLSTIIFAESGKMIPNWADIIDLTEMIMAKSYKEELQPDNIIFLFNVLLRNCDIRNLSSFHKAMFDFQLKTYPGAYLAFFMTAFEISNERLFLFGGLKYLQRFIDENWNNQGENIALFLLELNGKASSKHKVQLKVPNLFTERILSDLSSIELDDLFGIFWRAIILKNSSTHNFAVLHPILKNLLNCDDFEVNNLVIDTIGLILQSIHSSSEENMEEVLKLAVSHFMQLRASKSFLKGLLSVIQHISDKTRISKTIKENPAIIIKLTDNLTLPDADSRTLSLKLLFELLSTNNQEIPILLNECKNIEQIPLTLDNGRAITARLRSMGEEFNKTEPTELVTNIFFKHMLGLLTVRFAPVWEGIKEILPSIYKKNADLVWELIFKVLTFKNDSTLISYPDDLMEEDLETALWTSTIDRLSGSLTNFAMVWSRYQNSRLSILSICKEGTTNLNLPSHTRGEVLKILLLIPQLAETNSKNFVPFLFNDKETAAISSLGAERSETEISASSWQDMDRNLLLKILAKFKNIKNIYHSEEVFNRLLVLLSSRNSDVQKLALEALFCYKLPILIKYRDNLRNMLDDRLFKDEVITLLTNNDASTIDEREREDLMVFVLRILFGRAQTPVTSGIKKSRKSSVLNVLPNFDEKYITDFLKLASVKLNFENFYERNCINTEEDHTVPVLRKMIGFVNVINLSLPVLGTKFPSALISLLQPLLYCIATTNTASTSDSLISKFSSSLRQSSLKALNILFQNASGKVLWEPHIEIIFRLVVRPRLTNFANENLQQPSSLLKLFVFWTSNKDFYKFLYYDEYAVIKSLMEIISHEHAKESVVSVILEGSLNIIKTPAVDDKYVELVALIASTCLHSLPKLYQRIDSPSALSVAADLLLTMTELGYVQDDETKMYLLQALCLIIDSGFKNVSKPDISKFLKVLAVLIPSYDCKWSDMESLFKSASKHFQLFKEKELRLGLTAVFSSISERFTDFRKTAQFLEDLNSYSDRRMHEYDFPRILSSFEQFLKHDYKVLTDVQWVPVLYTFLYYIVDQDELALRNNATHGLNCFIDYCSEKASTSDAAACVSMLKTIILPNLRNGLRKSTEDIQSEYISVLAYIVQYDKYYKELDDMKLLLGDGDEEINFFINIKHVQLHRRQRAIRRLATYTASLSDASIAHYLIPMIESYVFSKEEKYRNIGNEALLTIGTLSQVISWNQYKALLRRYIAMVRNTEDKLSSAVLLINHLSSSLKNTLTLSREESKTGLRLSKFPSSLEEPEQFIKKEIYPVLLKILSTRNEETILSRIPLTEGLVTFILGLADEDAQRMLPGILTSVCQVLRSRSDELRDAVRSTLSKVSVSLGYVYLPFLLRELKSALQRGSQVHILSYTVHHILRTLSENLSHGDLDESAFLLVSIIMQDIFGAAGQEKESDNYHTQMKEIKVNRSYDTAEILSSNISLHVFNEIIRPIKALLLEKMGLKNQNKLDELLRRYALGLNHNDFANSKDVLTLCYEIFRQSEENHAKKFKKGKSLTEQEEYFLVNLNFKNTTVQMESSLFIVTFQKFSLDLFRTVITRHRDLMNPAYLENFIPLLREALLSEHEGVLVSALRVLIILVKLEFSEESESLFKSCARKVLNLIKDSPSTSSELCQMGLKFLSSFIRHKDIKLKDTALSYVLSRILPDLNEPSKQGLAFNFLKALVSKHIMLPEIYDVLTTAREIMVTNHSKEIRDVSRSVYYQFLMEYDQSKGRLEKQFKFMIDNLQYPSQEGRQSIMELLNLIINKANESLLSRLSSSFFLSLSNVLINDDSPRCREMSSILLTNMLKKLNAEDLKVVEKYLTAWLKQSNNTAFISLGLRVFKIYLLTIGIDKNHVVEELALKRIENIISNVQVGSDTQWDLIYTALNVFDLFVEKTDKFSKKEYKSFWIDTISCLLYPHMWVRQSSSKLVSMMLFNLDKFEEPFTDLEIQNVVSRIVHQLSAPSIPETLSTTSIKSLIHIASRWQMEETKYIGKEDEEFTYKSAIDFMVHRISKIIRSEDKAADTFNSKKTGIQFFTLLGQALNEDELDEVCERIMLSLYVYLETEKRYMTEEQESLSEIAQECFQVMENKLDVSSFTKHYANVKQSVIKRRQERKAKRSTLALTAPDRAAQKKINKHIRSREKRKHEKDENGYYQRKNKRKRS